jgi:hypothetical protein
MRLVLALVGLVSLKVAAWALADRVITQELLTALTLFDAAALFVAPSWVATAGANRATGPLRTFALVPAIQLVLIASNIVLQSPSIFGRASDVLLATSRVSAEAVPRSMLGGTPGALALWLIATLFAFAYVAVRLRFVPTQTDRRRAAAFVAAHYTAKLGRDPRSVAEARPETVVRAKDALAAAAAAAAGLSALAPAEEANPEAAQPSAESDPTAPPVTTEDQAAPAKAA